MSFTWLRYARIGDDEEAGETYFVRLSIETQEGVAPFICVDFVDAAGAVAIDEDDVFFPDQEQAMEYVTRRFGELRWLEGSP